MRTGTSIALKPADRRRVTTLALDRNASHKHVCRTEIFLMNADEYRRFTHVTDVHDWFALAV
jgi:hypothetical protein